MNESENMKSHAETGRRTWGVLGSWKLWICISLLALITFTATTDLIVNQRRAELGKQMSSTALRFEWSLANSVPVRLWDAVLHFQRKDAGWLKTPYSVRAVHTKLNRVKFERMARLNLTEFRGEAMMYDVEDAVAFIRRSPRLQLFLLEHSASLPFEAVEQLRRERPELQIIQKGSPIIGVGTRSVWPGLEVEFVDKKYFPGLDRGEVLLKLNGKPVDTWQQVLRVLKAKESNDPDVFIVRGTDGVEREQVYQQPFPNFHAQTRLLLRDGE